ncbi:MAG: hypothetical protein IKF41_01745, partial [Alphaproteobacteria bacterium]|nr:hypothetical protein [Alphaproteobacteria bacterium]
NCPVNTYLVDVGDSESEPECRPCPTNSVSAGGQATTCTCSEGYTASYTGTERNGDNLQCVADCPAVPKVTECGIDHGSYYILKIDGSISTRFVNPKCACPQGYLTMFFDSVAVGEAENSSADNMACVLQTCAQ